MIALDLMRAKDAQSAANNGT
jgi:hypothetical protein